MHLLPQHPDQAVEHFLAGADKTGHLVDHHLFNTMQHTAVIRSLNTRIADHNRTSTSGPGSDMTELSVEEILARRRTLRERG